MGAGVELHPIHAIAGRIDARKENLALEMVHRYAEDIVDYRMADESFLHGDVYAVSLENIEVLAATLMRGEPPAEAWLEKTRRGAARRVHQGISLESFLPAPRLWGQLAWEAALESPAPAEPAEREAALEIAGLVLRHVDIMSATWAAAYVAEAEGISNDRAVLRRDLLDALIAGKGDTERIRRLARSLGLQLADGYVVAVLRAEEAGDDVALRSVVEAAREHLRPDAASLLVGMRRGGVVALSPLAEPAGIDEVRRHCAALAARLGPEGVSVGMGAWHAGRTDIGI